MQYVTINSDALTSAAFTLADPNKRHALAVPSMTAAAVRLEFSQTSGSAPYFPLARDDGSGAVFTAHSGTGPAFAVLPLLPTAWGRISVTTGTASTVQTFTLYPLTSRW